MFKIPKNFPLLSSGNKSCAQALRGVTNPKSPLSLGLVALDGFKQLPALISKVQCPVFVIQGSKDETVTSKSAQTIFNNLKNQNKELWIIEGGIHPLMRDFCKEELFERTLTFLEEKTKLEL